MVQFYVILYFKFSFSQRRVLKTIIVWLINCLCVRGVRKTSETDFREKASYEVFRCWEHDSEVSSVGDPQAGDMAAGLRKHRKLNVVKMRFGRFFDVQNSNLRWTPPNLTCVCGGRTGWVVTLFDTYSQDTVFKPRYHQSRNALGQVTNG